MLNKKVRLLTLLSAMVFLLSVFSIVILPKMAKGEVYINENKYYEVYEVIDGDTFKVKEGFKKSTIRMLGIDTPETVDPRKEEQCYGKEASEFAKKFLLKNKVRLVLNEKREMRDKYGRVLAYVYLEDGTFVNSYLLANGFAKEYTFGKPYSKKDEFVATQNEARQRGVGLWDRCNS